MIYYCALCRDLIRKSEQRSCLCSSCYHLIEQSAFYRKTEFSLAYGQKLYPVFTPFKYSEDVRELVLNAKAGKEPASLDACASLLLECSDLTVFMRGVSYITPAPSSFWSRLKAKADLAVHLAEALSVRYDVPIVWPPMQNYWKLGKSARIPGEIRRENAKLGSLKKRPWWQGESEDSSVLLVDDVITTGNTLASQIGSRTEGFKLLAFASAYKEPNRESDGVKNEPDTDRYE